MSGNTVSHIRQYLLLKKCEKFLQCKSFSLSEYLALKPTNKRNSMWPLIRMALKDHSNEGPQYELYGRL